MPFFNLFTSALSSSMSLLSLSDFSITTFSFELSAVFSPLISLSKETTRDVAAAYFIFRVLNSSSFCFSELFSCSISLRFFSASPTFEFVVEDKTLVLTELDCLLWLSSFSFLGFDGKYTAL
eukprot:TRINITY_DN15457_c0_g3_i1.p1 TRINITY_DN15457_c0_g3~~TRINITY_DN15457_c0_g3_i1.p1  ORF type:complete len:122 (+),score=10.82 TRINITY_DN15457_c0_g3_i1:275-640(+)